MVVKGVSKAKVENVVEKAMGEEVSDLRAVDITFYNEDGKEIEPLKAVKVTLTTDAFDAEEAVSVVHVEDLAGNQAEVMDLTKATDTTAVFNTDGFSVYVIVESIVPRLTVKFMNGSTERCQRYPGPCPGPRSRRRRYGRCRCRSL